LIGLHNFGKFVYIAYKIRFLLQIEHSVNATIGIFGSEYKNHTAAYIHSAAKRAVPECYSRDYTYIYHWTLNH